MSGAAVAVAVVSFQTRDLLAACLESLRPEHDAGRAEVWVVDNLSTDGSADMVRERFDWVRLVEPGENLGFGRAVNLVADQTSTPWVAPANADIALQPGALERLLETGARHPGAGIVAPRLVRPDGSTQHSVFPFPSVPFTAAFNLGVPAVVPGLGDRWCLEGRWDPDRERDVPWAIGAFLLVRREAWDAAGGFDDQQWMYAEDLDLGWRVRRAGFSTRYVPGAVVHHAESAATAAAWGDDRVRRWQDSTYDWMRRRRGRTRTRAVAALNIAGALARWAWMTPVARVRPQPWAARRRAVRRWAQLHRSGLR